jgi:hypothetical protein
MPRDLAIRFATRNNTGWRGKLRRLIDVTWDEPALPVLSEPQKKHIFAIWTAVFYSRLLCGMNQMILHILRSQWQIILLIRVIIL